MLMTDAIAKSTGLTGEKQKWMVTKKRLWDTGVFHYDK
jgi:hypothetical protein